MRAPSMSSIVERRLLVNYRVDPEVAASLLPAPLRPQLANGWGVAGICLIRLGRLRPSWYLTGPGCAPRMPRTASPSNGTRRAAARRACTFRGVTVIQWRRSSRAGACSPASTTTRPSTCARPRRISTWPSPARMARPAPPWMSAWHSGSSQAPSSPPCRRHRTSSGVDQRDSPLPATAAGSTAWSCRLIAGPSSRSRLALFVGQP